MDFVSFVTENGDAIFTAVLGVHALAVVVVNATDTPADDKWLGRIYKAVEYAAGVFGLKAKQYPGESEY